MNYFSDEEEELYNSDVSGGNNSDDDDEDEEEQKTTNLKNTEIKENEPYEDDNYENGSIYTNDDDASMTDIGDEDEDDEGEGDQTEDEEMIKTEKSDKNKKDKKSITSKITATQSKTLNYGSIDDDYEDDEDDEYDENYLQKFNNGISENYVLNTHPECVMHNYNEVLSMCSVIRDANGIIIDDLHKTIPFLTKYERARILGVRTKQLNCGATPFIKLEEGIIDGYVIAQMELKEKKIPFIIRRPMPNGGSEYWFLKDLEDLSF